MNEAPSEWDGSKRARAEPPALPSTTPLDGLEIVALDFETTGLSAWRGDEVCEVGLVRAVGAKVEPLLSTFVNPGKRIPAIVQGITGIHDEDVVGAPRFHAVIQTIHELIGARPIVMHNAPFDLAFLKRGADDHGIAMLNNLSIDTLLISRFLNQGQQQNSLNQVSRRLNVDRGRSHRATDDASTAARVFHALLPDLRQRGIDTVGGLVDARLAAPAEELVAAPSSVILDMLTRAVVQQDVVVMTIAALPSTPARAYHIRPLAVIADRELTAEITRLVTSDGSDGFELEGERSFRILDIMTLQYEGVTFVSPWATPEQVRDATG